LTVSVEIKFCGLTRAEDAEYAASLGAAYVGAIFASGPRLISAERAARIFERLPVTTKRVGVFGDQSVDEILRAATAASLNAVQLHGSGDVSRIRTVRDRFDGEVWSVIRVAGAELPRNTDLLAHESDGLLIDAYVPGQLGGTGVALPWNELAAEILPLRSSTKIILAGGLKAENVERAINALVPDAVDVSSGVEDAPGIKNHDRMRAFRDAVVHAPIPT
jgi:phosphoribosylanthranilate isomerase